MEFDDNWIESYESKEKDYNVFYLDKNKSINIITIILDAESNITKVTKEKYKLNNDNLFTKDEIINIISKNSNKNLVGLLCYNSTIEPKNIVDNNLFFDDVKSFDVIKDISLSDSISFFSILNSVYFLFKENKKNNIILKKKLNSLSTVQSKKIYITKNNRKTRRKRT